jgi:hypothetical protein
MPKAKDPFQSKGEQVRKVKALEKFSKGDYGVGKSPETPDNFLSDAVVKEGLEDVFVNDDQQSIKNETDETSK